MKLWLLLNEHYLWMSVALFNICACFLTSFSLTSIVNMFCVVVCVVNFPNSMRRAKKIREVYNKAGETFTIHYAKDWLYRRIPSLNNVRPVDILGNPDGNKVVMDTICRIEHGVYM